MTTKLTVNALYVCVFDMQRARHFYETRIFGRPPVSNSDRFSAFDINGFLFCLFAPAVEGEPHQIGNNCVATIETDDLDSLLQSCEQSDIRIHRPPRTVDGMRLFQILDSEDNIVEFYQQLNP